MTDIQDKNNILYRPNLGIPKNYYSDGTINYDNESSSTTDLGFKTEDLQEQIELIKRSLLFVPGEIRPQTESILNLVHFLLVITEPPDGNEEDHFYEIIKPGVDPGIVDNTVNKPSKPSSDSATPPTTTQSDGSTTDATLNRFFEDHKPVTVLKQIVTDDLKIKRHYSNTILEITGFYISKLGDVLATYHSQLFAYPGITDFLEEVYKTSLIDYKNYVAHSILQTLLKSQQEKISKMRLYQKLYNEKQSITLLKSLEYSKLSLIKLIDNAPKDPKLYYKHIQTIETEKKRLDKKMFEYYRYLDSSLEILSSCLNMHLTEGIAKAELHKINDIKGE